MKLLLLVLITAVYSGTGFTNRSVTNAPGLVSPLASFSEKWNEPKYRKCNTAAKTKYLSDKEKELIYILNLARNDPKLFANTVVKKYPDRNYGYLRSSNYYQSLLDTMLSLKSMPLLQPDSLGWVSANCHAISSGNAAFVGHERQDPACNKKRWFDGECCDYGHAEPLDILMSLMIDEEVPTLGHRKICFSDYGKIGVSIQSHKRYGTNAVLDFVY